MLRDYLLEFREKADEWFKDHANCLEHYIFFQEFIKKENLEKAEWADFQKIGMYIHAFSSMALAKKKALGNPNHSIEHYRRSFLYLVYGSEPLETRIDKFANDDNYQLRNFGESAVSEIVGYIFADQFVLYNERDKYALRLLEIDVDIDKKDSLAQKLVKFNRAIAHVIAAYQEIVGHRTSAPVNLEVDQFFSYLYETYPHENQDGKGEEVSAEGGNEENIDSGVDYWVIAPGRHASEWDEFTTEGLIAIGWDHLGDLRQYRDYMAIREKLQNEEGAEGSQKHSVRACYEFARVMKLGDFVFAKKGRSEILGYGQITSDYAYDSSRRHFRHTRKVKWLEKGNWRLPEHARVSIKTLTKVTKRKAFLEFMLPKVKEGEKREHLIDEALTVERPTYDAKSALSELFVEEAQFIKMLELLRRKKNVILQGPPGVGKSFMAKRLAFALMGVKDKTRVEMIQFHQSFSYEDFIQGYRPNARGEFRLKTGIFVNFCQRAMRAPGEPYVFIIDEINRGNLSKIFGELMLLIEADKRGQEFALPLTYAEGHDDKFYLPDNMYLLGTMNTADRSLAMVDYALRRRFTFVDLEPAFANAKFRQYLLDHQVENSLVEKIIERLTEVNAIIANDKKNLGRGFCIGHSFFCPDSDGKVYDQAWYEQVIEYEILPLLNEYWFDELSMVEDLEKRLLPK